MHAIGPRKSAQPTARQGDDALSPRRCQLDRAPIAAQHGQVNHQCLDQILCVCQSSPDKARSRKRHPATQARCVAEPPATGGCYPLVVGRRHRPDSVKHHHTSRGCTPASPSDTVQHIATVPFLEFGSIPNIDDNDGWDRDDEVVECLLVESVIKMGHRQRQL